MHQNSDIIAWIAREIIPHEVAIRKWLARRWSHVIDVDDVIQEAYCRIANLASVAHIDNPGGYFHQTASSVVTDQMRRRSEERRVGNDCVSTCRHSVSPSSSKNNHII